MNTRIRNVRHAFTLVELLVVISIIVILLALLVPGLNKALNYAEKANCAANQRNIAQVLSGYSLDQRYMLPPSVVSYSKSGATRTSTGQKNPTNNQTMYIDLRDTSIEVSDFAYAMDYRGVSQTQVNQTQDKSARAPRYSPFDLVLAATATQTTDSSVNQAPVGLGILVAIGALPSTELGDIAHCPSLNTKSAAPTSKFGTDETYTIAAGQTPDNQGGNAGAGGSYYVDPAQANSRIIGSYNYRGTSYALSRGGTAVIQYSQIGPSFVLTMDFPDARYGKKYHHKDGYNVSYGDGHSAYFEDPDNKIETISGVTPEGAAIWTDATGQEVNQTTTPVDGRTRPDRDEAIYEYVASGK